MFDESAAFGALTVRQAALGGMNRDENWDRRICRAYREDDVGSDLDKCVHIEFFSKAVVFFESWEFHP